MNKGRIYLICIAVVILTSIYAALTKAQTENLDAKGPLLKEGQMFTVKLVPAGKRLEVRVTGHQVAQLKMSDVGLTAAVRIGNRVVTVAPERKGDRFVIQTPSKELPSALKLNVQYGKKTEQFNFELNQTQP